MRDVTIAAAPPRQNGRHTQLWLFFVQEYLRLMRGRVALLLWAIIIYALLFVPLIMNGPQEELVRSLASWLGGADIGRNERQDALNEFRFRNGGGVQRQGKAFRFGRST